MAALPSEDDGVSDAGLPFLGATVGDDPVGDFDGGLGICEGSKLGQDEEREEGKGSCEHGDVLFLWYYYFIPVIRIVSEVTQEVVMKKMMNHC